ncbi:tetratricopeptide repeat protein [Selenihalanaerobacter shriftii]|uniref:Tetratricopeptide repeat-containing protein n=1 Tax=Selenihalanaerobacter shriftii TaxID=142842 RepID=A0A1T4LET2_9FIRM|nr:tetratricopeptide repeat protein [Selenihalanaerobacter shriftii]SJZ53170.1 Tetratricopeptide repeat-containing protein [Selenihalanaerobacter shriftii]
MSGKNDKQKTMAIFMIIVFVASVFVAAAGFISSSNNSQQTNYQSNSQGDSQKINNLKQRLSDNPQDVQAMIDLGNAYYDQRNYEKAINYYEASLRFEPEHAHVLVDLGTAYYYKQNSNPQKAIELYNKALEVDPDFKNALFNKGVVYQRGIRNYQKAIKAWQAFIAEYPNGQMTDKAKEFLAEARSSAKNPDQISSPQSTNAQSTIADYKARLGENPQDVAAMINLGHAYFDQQNFSKAINYYETSLKFKPNNVSVLVDLGIAYRKVNNPKKAIGIFDKALEIDPDFKNALFNKGIVTHFDLKDYQKAAKAWQAFLAKYPNGKMVDKARKFLNEAKNSIN